MMWMMQQQDRFSGLPCGLSSVNDAGEGSTVQCENAGDAATWSPQWLDGLNDVDDAAARPLQWLAMWTVQCK